MSHSIDAEDYSNLLMAADDGSLPKALAEALEVGSDMLLTMETVARALSGRCPKATEAAVTILTASRQKVETLGLGALRSWCGGTDAAVAMALGHSLGGLVIGGVDDMTTLVTAPNPIGSRGEVELTIDLGKGVNLVNGRSIEIPILPSTVVNDLPGRMLASVVSHPLLDPLRLHIGSAENDEDFRSTRLVLGRRARTIAFRNLPASDMTPIRVHA